MKHPKSRGERRAVRGAYIARRRFIATKIWTRYNEEPHEGSPLYQQQPGWRQPVEWGKYAKFNLNCGCRMCHHEKYFKEKRKRRRALDEAIQENLRAWQEEY
jgi:hypothetical protein